MDRTRKRSVREARDGHGLKDATIEELKWIFQIYQEDEENNSFLADPKHYKK